MGWLNPPPVVAVTGNVGIRCFREIQKARRAAKRKKRRVEYVEGDTAEVARLLASTVFFSDEKILVIVRDPQKVDLGLILRHHQSNDRTVVLLLHHDGALRSNSKLRKAIEKHGIIHQEYLEPKSWEAEGAAVKFVLKEAKARGKSFAHGDAIPKALVRACGTDLGFLAFEVFKLAALCDARKMDEIQPAHVRGLVSVVHETSVFPVVDALGRADQKELLRLLYSVERTHRDPTMLVCSVLAANVATWLHVGSLVQAGVDPEEAARTAGVSPVRLRRSLLPAAERWGQPALVALLRSIVEVERAVKSGKLNPWMLLQARLSTACQAVAAAG